jgi:hypothetical protein
MNIIYGITTGIITGIVIFAAVKIIVNTAKEMSYKSSIRKEADEHLRILRGN